MSIARSCAAVVAAVLPVLGCRGGGAGGPKVTLRYHPPAGAAYHYAMEQQNSMRIEGGPMSAMPEQQLTMRMYFTQLVGGPTDGGTAVTVTFDSTALEAPGMMPGAMQPALDRMRGMKSDVVYDERMQVVRAAFTGLAGTPNPVTEELGKNLKAMAFPLPAAPVGVGDSWTAERELALGEQVNASAPVKSHNKLTVKEIQVTGADTAVLLAVETTFPGDPIELSQQGQHVTMRLSGGLTGEQLYSLTKSAPVRGTMSGTLRIHVKGATPAQGEMTMAMTQQTTLRLTGAPAPAP
jgi:hypothetical protein